MQELTFRGFLARHVKTMSYCESNNLKKLACEAVSDNPRLREPLLLYALFSHKQALLLDSVRGTSLFAECADLLLRYDIETMTQLLMAESPVLRREYHKVWRSYQYFRNRSETDSHTKELIRQRVLQLQKESNTSCYRMCKDMGLSRGNINRWLKHGDCRQVSLNNGWKMIEYLEGQNSRCVAPHNC